MAYEQKPNTGALFRNDKREKDTHAHARGDALIDGVAYYVDAWTNTDRNGNKYQSLKFKRKEQVQRVADDPRTHGTVADDMDGGSAAAPDDEIPF